MQPLDNVIWYALTTRQAEFAERRDQACRFQQDVSPLAAFLEPTNRGYESLESLVATGESVGLFLDDPYQEHRGWKVVGGAPLLQMVCGNGVASTAATGVKIVELGRQDTAEMQDLAALTKPGPFAQRTRELGTYLGIRVQGKLIAMAGERMKVPGHTEVSAVCTHPDHVGKGYARTLMTEVMCRIRERHETPFLHVRQDNAGAIGLYKKLEFQERKFGHYVVIQKL
jgi:ribosomal protein S18 acetylase RimI-like enzyme